MTTGRKPKIVENPTMKEVKTEGRHIQSHLRNLSIYGKFKMLCIKQNRSIQSAMKEAIMDMLKKYGEKI
tara:strand:- start:441 stop:647 length:207 start_codon:yes stop_codon:yes gene_type:complete